jgi:multidrug transporter EmrE-like cation transporter
MGMTPLLSGTLLTLVEAIGDYALKRYALGAGIPFFGVGLGIYASLAFLLVWIFKSFGLAIVNAYWDATSNVLSMLVGAFLLNEVYSAKQWIGMITVTIGMFLINGSH